MFLMPCIRDARVPPADAGAPPTLAWARLTIGIVRSDLDLSPEWLPLAALYLEAECICIMKLCRFEASSILPPYRRVLTARDYPCRWAVRIFCIAVNGAVAAAVQPQLTEPISQSARRLPVCCSVELAGVGRCGRRRLWPSVAADRRLCRQSARIRPTCRSWRTSSAFSNGKSTTKHMRNPCPEPRASLSKLESPNAPLPRCRPSSTRNLRTDSGWATRHFHGCCMLRDV